MSLCSKGKGHDQFFDLIDEGNLDGLKTCLKKVGYQPREDGCTPLHYAVEQGKSDVARLLLENGADPVELYEGWSPLQV